MFCFNELPFEIIKHQIFPFIFCICDFCNRENHRDDVSLNIYMKKYISIFENEFYIVTPDARFYKALCNQCHVNMLNNGYFPISYKNNKKYVD